MRNNIIVIKYHDNSGLNMHHLNSETDAKRFEQISQEGRSRFLWGDSPEKVSAWLCEQGCTPAQIEEVLKTARIERAQAVRAAGIDDMITGFLFIVVFGGMFLVMFFTRLRFALVDFTGLSGAAFGLYRLLRGVYRLMEGGDYQGSVTELSRDD